MNIGGVFRSPKGGHDPGNHPVGFRVRIGSILKRLAKLVQIEVEGVVDGNGYIDRFTDAHSDTVNSEVTGGRNFTLTGDKIKVDGDAPECGVYFEMTDGSGTRIKVQERLTQNTPTKIIGRIPMLMAPRSYRVVIVTQFNGSNASVLKGPKTLISSFELGAE